MCNKNELTSKQKTNVGHYEKIYNYDKQNNMRSYINKIYIKTKNNFDRIAKDDFYEGYQIYDKKNISQRQPVVSWETVLDDAKFNGLSYDCALRKNNKRGVFVGLKFKNEQNKFNICSDNNRVAIYINEKFIETGKNTDRIGKDEFLQGYQNMYKLNNITWQTVLNDVKRLGLTYDPALRKNNKRGVILGLKFNKDDTNEVNNLDFLDDNDNQNITHLLAKDEEH